MENNGFLICSNENDKKLLLEIFEYVSESISLSDEKVCVFADSSEELPEGEIYVVDDADKGKAPAGKKIYTYSESFGSATVSALNPQQREKTSSFEIMTDNFMGRAYLSNDSKFTMKQILIAFTALLAKGGEASKILSLINEFTKEKD